MKWRTDKTSTRVEDRRGASSRIPGGAAGGIGGIGLIIILLAAVFIGVDPDSEHSVLHRALLSCPGTGRRKRSLSACPP